MALIDGAIIPQGAGSRYTRAEANAKGSKAASSDLNQTGNVGNQIVAFTESIDRNRNGVVRGQNSNYDDAETNNELEDPVVAPLPSQERPQPQVASVTIPGVGPQNVSEIV